MRAPRITIAGMVVAITIIAIDCAMLRFALAMDDQRFPDGLTIVGSIPVVDALIVGLVLLVARRRRDGRAGMFLRGFLASGLLALLIYWLAMFFKSEAILEALPDPDLVVNRIASWFERMGLFGARGDINEVVEVCIGLGLIFVIFSTPQLLLALIGGWVARRLRGPHEAVPVAAKS